MHTIEPYYNWRGFYIASEDIQSPFFERIYSEFEFTDSIYNFCIHPQWDHIGSPSWFIKILYTEYVYPFEIAAVILVVAIIAAISLTLRRREGVKKQNQSEQVRTKKSDRLRMVKMDSEKRTGDRT